MTNPKDPRSELEEKIVLALSRMYAAGLKVKTGEIGLEAKEIMQAVDSYVGERERLARVNELDHILFTDDAHVFSKWLIARINQLQAERKDGV